MSVSTHLPTETSVSPSRGLAAAPGERIGDRFSLRLIEDRLREALVAGGQGRPASVGLIEIESDPTTAGLGLLTEQVAGRISTQLPPGARLVGMSATRFVIAMAGEPLLEALMSIDRIRDALEREQWSVGRERVSLAFGAGVATRRGCDEPVAETLAAAERSLAHSRRLAVRRHSVGAEDAPDEEGWIAPAPLDLSSAGARTEPRAAARWR